MDEAMIQRLRSYIETLRAVQFEMIHIYDQAHLIFWNGLNDSSGVV